MDSFDLLQKLDAQHGKKSDYKTTVNMEDINKLVSGMATALITTLYGAIAANLIMLPLADKISLNSGKVMDFIMLEYKAIRCIRSGYTPKMIQEILSTYLEESEKVKLEESIKANK